MADQELFVWTKMAGMDHHRTNFTDQEIEEYDWRAPEYFYKYIYFFADAEGNVPDVPVAEVGEEVQEQITSLVNWLYDQEWGTVGGPFHIVTDDNNLEDGHIEFCLKEIDAHWSTEGLDEDELAKLRKFGTLLQSLSVGARHEALRSAESVGGAY